LHKIERPAQALSEEEVPGYKVKADLSEMNIDDILRDFKDKEKLHSSTFKTGASAAETGEPSGADEGAMRSILRVIYSVNLGWS
jgi:hypothetical protein